MTKITTKKVIILKLILFVQNLASGSEAGPKIPLKFNFPFRITTKKFITSNIDTFLFSIILSINKKKRQNFIRLDPAPVYLNPDPQLWMSDYSNY